VDPARREIRHIAIEGVIGAGKTTLAALIAERLAGRLVLERFDENPFLPSSTKTQSTMPSRPRSSSC